jgi:hypothetical protein
VLAADNFGGFAASVWEMARAQQCTYCGCDVTFRVYRKPGEYFLLGYRAFCCGECTTRYIHFEIGKLLQWGSAA